MASPFSRLMIAGTGGDAGKTLLCLGLLATWRREGQELRAFKKGPDFIDAAWLGWASGAPGRNLDTYMMAPEVAHGSFCRHGAAEGLNIIEGNRGLLDGVDATGTHSSASLARLLDCPVILVVSPVKVTATAAAAVLGCRQLAPGVRIAGVVLNRVRGERHERVVREAIEQRAGVPVLGVLPPLEGPGLPSRHLGLVPPAEHGPAERLRTDLERLVAANLDRERLLSIARAAAPLMGPPEPPAEKEAEGPKVRIGYFRDSAFTFYYPENLEALEASGATLVTVSALADRELPVMDALYIGGGFPETHAERLAGNSSLLQGVRRAAAAGLPIYAECGGLMVLAESLEWRGKIVPMAGALPIRVRMHDRPQGHGYSQIIVDAPNPFLPVGTVLKGHEFHYSSIIEEAPELRTAFAVVKGQGSFHNRDGVLRNNVLASYLHVHALGAPEWAKGMVEAARRHRDRGGQGGPDRPQAA
jgi:cobyrinic acid a,c-diamide synthase